MVRINNNTWITATTYGSVISSISSDHQLERVYLDNEATNQLRSKSNDFVIKELQKNHINTQGFSNILTRFDEEKSYCDRISKMNHWVLFSLFPLQISAQTLNYCNARCDFCYANAPNALNQKTMNLSILHSLKEYAAINGIKFGVSGGEPLLHPDIFDILSYRNNEVFDTLITNLTPTIDLDRLINTEVDLIQVSIHGYDNIHNKLLRIPDAYEKVMRRIRYLSSKINIATNTVITQQNIDSIPDFVHDLNDLQKSINKSLTYVRFVPVVPSGTGNDKYDIEKDFFDESERVLRKLMNNYDQLNFEIPMIHANPYEYRNVGDRWMCPAGSTVAVVRLDGHVVPCNQFLDTTIHSKTQIEKSSFHDIWLNDPLFSTFRKGSIATKDSSCKECVYLLKKEQEK